MPPASELTVALGGPADVRTARNRLRVWLRGAGLAESFVQEILVAVGEATTNAVEHSGAVPRAGRPSVCMRAVLEPAGVRITVTDRGRWREPRVAEARRHRGRGRTLMRALVDHVDVRTGPDGTTVELVKVLPA